MRHLSIDDREDALLCAAIRGELSIRVCARLLVNLVRYGRKWRWN